VQKEAEVSARLPSSRCLAWPEERRDAIGKITHVLRPIAAQALDASVALPLRELPPMGYNGNVLSGAVAQGIEQRFPKPCVAGSIPASPTHFNSPTQTPLQEASPTTPPATSKRVMGDFLRNRVSEKSRSLIGGMM
jgi:hypothetical protein